MYLQKFLIGGLFLCWQLNALGQSKALQKANDLYQANHYAEAAELYEIALQEKTNLSVKSKLANCYRMNNRLEEAEKLYAEIVVDEKAKSDTYFYYGEVLMGNEKYDEAKEWFAKFDSIEPDDERGKLMMDICERVKTIKPFFPYLRVDEFSQNSDADDSTPVYWGQGIVFSSDRKMGLKLMKEKSGWTGRDYLNLYYAENQGDNQYSDPELFSAKLNDLNKNTGNPSFTADGTVIYFTRNDFETSKNGSYNMQLFEAESLGGSRWKTPKKLKFCSSEFNYMHPAVSPDGQWMVFVSDKKGGPGGTDLWMVEKKGDDWGKPQVMTEVVNTVSNEGFPFIDSEGKLFFCSKGHLGYGGFDIFMTRKNTDGTWQTPINLGRPINSSRDDISITLDGEKRCGLFTSNRIGGDDDIFLFQAVATKAEAGFYAQEQPSIRNNPEIMEEVNPTKIDHQEEKKQINEAPLLPKKEDNSSSNKENNHPDFSLNARAGESVAAAEVGLKTPLAKPPLPFPEIANLLENNALEIGSTFRLDDAVFDFQVFQITPTIVEALHQVENLLKENPNLKIELGAHTDSFGTDADNLKLSRNRAVNAGIYLYRKGISDQQLVTKGYGEKMLLNHCTDGVECSMEEHLENQRLEIKILAF